jgi:uroporphyrinogen III methyltransferase/synthase
MKLKGKVYLVGAGPGDLGLLTLRGAELLKKADVVVYDALVNQQMLRLAPQGAQLVFGGKRANDHAIPQGELNALLVRLAREGKNVVRLKGGDPYVFGRGAEEAEELVAAGIEFEVVPGISSIVAGPNYAGIPVTHREHCSTLTVITGHEDPAKPESQIDWEQMARTSGTKVILMGVERIANIAAKLIEHGMKPKTPAATIRWATTGRQETVQSTLQNLAQEIEKAGLKAPAITVIGDVVKCRSKLNWFEKRPLFGQRIVVTRTREQASQLSAQLSDRGADVLEIPTIKIVPPDDRERLKDAIIALHEYDWIVFTSPNGVTTFFDYFFKGFEDLRDVGGVKIAAVGPATAAKLKELHLKVEVMPDEYVTSQIAKALTNYESIDNLRILLMRAEVANLELPKELERLGAIVDDVASYKTIPETEDTNGAAARLEIEGAHWITFTSSSTAENFNKRFPLEEILKKFPKIRFASIGPETTKTLKALGYPPHVEAKKHSIDGLVQAIESAPKERGA